MSSPKKLAVAAADESHVLDALFQARNNGLVDSVLIGDEKRIQQIAEQHGYDLHGLEIVNIDDKGKAAQYAVNLVRTGQAHIVMKGLLDTSVFLKTIIDKDNGLRGTGLLSYVTVHEMTKMNKLILVSDPAINMEPGYEEKERIMLNAVRLSKALENNSPKVALICPIEKINPRINSTVHASMLTEKYSDNTDFSVQGPMALDIAVSPEAAEIKGVGGTVAGHADILIANDLGVGNVLYKSLVHFAETRVGCVVLGATAPVIITSRSDSADTKLNSIKLGILLSDLTH